VDLVTYAQNREDLYLWALVGHVERGTYVDVGAYDSTLHSVTRLFYDRGWHGINIEANARRMASFLRDRPGDINLCTGVSSAPGTATFREYPDYDGMSTLDPGMKHLHEAVDRPFVDREVPVTTLAAVLSEHGVRHVDFLKVDVEGHELAVLQGNDWNAVRPTVVTFEGVGGQEVIDYMSALGYRLEFFDGLNYYMVDESAGGTVAIHNYAARVLMQAVRTAREVELETALERRAHRGAHAPEKAPPTGPHAGARSSMTHRLRCALTPGLWAASRRARRFMGR
jgi:FkbM family methyltransferase